MRYSIISAGACLLACANAHFDLVYPEPRGKNAKEMTKGPCGAFSSPSDKRTEVSLDDHAVSVALNLHHDETVVEVLMGVGNDVGDAFNFKLIPSFKMEGMGDFCLPKVDLEAQGIKIEDGTNATLQVITNGDPKGGLYSCADITFKKSASFSKYDSCKNNTGFKEIALKGSAAKLNANETTADGTPQSGDDGHDHGHSHSHSHDDDDDDDDDHDHDHDHDHEHESGATSIAGASWVVLGAAIAGALALI